MNLWWRFFRLVFSSFWRPRLAPLETSYYHGRVWPNDLDLNFHLNNGRFVTMMDLGRMDVTLRTGLFKTMFKHKWAAVAGQVNILFMRPLPPFSKYTLETRVISWDEKWVYIEQLFTSNKRVFAKAIVKVAFLKKGKRLSVFDVFSQFAPNMTPPPIPEYIQTVMRGDRELLARVKEIHRERFD